MYTIQSSHKQLVTSDFDFRMNLKNTDLIVWNRMYASHCITEIRTIPSYGHPPAHSARMREV